MDALIYLWNQLTFPNQIRFSVANVSILPCFVSYKEKNSLFRLLTLQNAYSVKLNGVLTAL
ncbi:hypothetical protein GCM10011571_32250 [Marinithermofilum abyssi]|uniref:Uncharacterized protein n=1 Tax=Marinithermofilum abyssi TaxID=1571185 RepID=A0A8J2VK65_9BACL|nr:hypothetical protein GCM10011571_32250 [Marinithermofilum abyssi]